MTRQSRTILGLLYAVALAVILSGASLSAAWQHGCCTGSNDCGDTKICCYRPDGWEWCDPENWPWYDGHPSYCNYNNCNLNQD